jgi:DNA repair protein RecO
MPQATVHAFVIGNQPLREQDKLAWLLTEEGLILKAVAPGAARVGNRFGSLLELFTAGDFQYYWNEERELVTLSRGEISRSYFHLVSAPENVFHCYLMAEVLIRFTPHQRVEPRMFRLLESVLQARAGGVSMRRLQIYFLLWMVRLEGLLFNPSRCASCAAVNLRRSWLRTDFRGTLCSACRRNESHELGPSEIDFIQWAQRHGPQELDQLDPQLDEAGLLKLFCRKIEYHGESALKSSRYLAEFR